MVQGYYTLQEAAQHLNVALDEMKQMAQKGKVRSFQDRGTLRFRMQDIQELARQRGVSSDPDLVLGEASLPPKKGEGPRSPKSPASPKTPARGEAPEVFDFELDENALAPPPSPKGKGKSSPRVPQAKEPPKSAAPPRSATLQVKSGGPPKSGITPRTGGVARDKPGSDSDVRLVASTNADVTLSVAPDSDIKLRERSSTKTPSSGSLPARPGHAPISDPTKKRPSKLAPSSPQPGPDSGVRLIPMDSDSDVKIVPGADEVPLGGSPNATLADSNVRLDKVAFPPQPEDSNTLLTDEINLDEELRKEEERQKQQPKQPTKVKPKSQLKFPTTSPFELSDSDVGQASSASGTGEAPASGAAPSSKAKPLSDSSDFDMTAAKDDSSNFDLQASPNDSSNFELQALDDSSGMIPLVPSDDSIAPLASGSSDDDFSLELEESESALGGGGGELTAPASGISLSNPIDAGISLEDQKGSDDSVDFDLSLEPEATPKPAQMKPVEASDEGSSEFELSLELPDEGKPASPDDSDSEFELTLDDSSGEVQAEQPQLQSDDETTAQDIFESDFEIPALQEEESAGEPATMDAETESSDFDLALDDSELAADEESGSQVVALDEEEVEVEADSDDEAEVQVDDEGFGDLEAEGAEGELDEEDDTRPARVEVREKVLKPAPWGALPAIVMFPCVIVMLLAGLVGFEVVQSSIANRPPGFMTRALNDNVLVQLGVTKPLGK